MVGMHTDHVTAWAWLWVATWACLGWIPVDIWLHQHGHPYLTEQMRQWMRSARYGWAIWAVLIALPVAFMAHMLIVGQQPDTQPAQRRPPAPAATATATTALPGPQAGSRALPPPGDH